MSSSPSSLSLWRRFLLPLTPRTTLPRSRGPMHCGSRCEWAYIRVRLRFLMGGTSVSTCITRSGLARPLAEDRSFYLRRRRRRSGKETGTISRFARSAPSSSRAFPLPSLFMNSLCPSHQHDACPRSPSQPRSAGPADELIDRSLLGVYAKRSTHRAREAGGSNGAPKTQVVLAILADRTSMMLMTCQVTPSGYLAFPKNV